MKWAEGASPRMLSALLTDSFELASRQESGGRRIECSWGREHDGKTSVTLGMTGQLNDDHQKSAPSVEGRRSLCQGCFYDSFLRSGQGFGSFLPLFNESGRGSANGRYY